MERMNVLICGGTGCTSSKSDLIAKEFERILEEKGLDKEVKVVKTGCFGLCQKGPIVAIHPDRVFYCQVKVEDVNEIVNEHIYK